MPAIIFMGIEALAMAGPDQAGPNPLRINARTANSLIQEQLFRMNAIL